MAPISFVQMPIVAVPAHILFDEKPDLWTVPGAIVTFAANAYITWRESHLLRTRMHETRAAAGGTES